MADMAMENTENTPFSSMIFPAINLPFTIGFSHLFPPFPMIFPLNLHCTEAPFYFVNFGDNMVGSNLRRILNMVYTCVINVYNTYEGFPEKGGTFKTMDFNTIV